MTILTFFFAESPKFNPRARQNTGMKLFTLYYSGRAPGEFSTRLTRLPVDSDGQPILRRQKRQSEFDAISPSRVEPIQATQAPAGNVYSELDAAVGDALLAELNNLFEIFSSFEVEKDRKYEKEVVTKTETITVTQNGPLCSNPK